MKKKEDTYRMETAAVCAEKINIGWNLGNALDACGIGAGREREIYEYEMQWKNPKITKDLIRLIKDAGYRAIRVPVTYYEHMDENGNIDPAWMKRVKEVVDDVLNEGLYCITNVHHDTGAGDQAWLRADSQVFEKVKDRYKHLWVQIAQTFRMYDEKLILEGINEMLDSQSRWDYTDSEGYECINQYHQIFVDTVRKTGGNNSERNLLLNTYGASPMEPAAKAFRLPEDSVSGHLMVGVHFYKPDAFAAGDMEQWNEAGEQEVTVFFERMDQYFGSKGIPVILGECGTHDIRTEEERIRYVRSVIAKARERKYPYFWWDDGAEMKLVDRRKNKFVYENLQKAIRETAQEDIDENL